MAGAPEVLDGVSYCVYELRMSEDEAFRRAQAARIARKFPTVFEQIAAGEIHLTGLLMLGPHLTEENHCDVLARAKHRTKKEIARLVRMLDPLPRVAAVVEPLGPEPTGHVVRGNPTWAQVTEAFAPPVRELEPGERPRDWAEVDDKVANANVSTEAATVESEHFTRPGDTSQGVDPNARAHAY